MRLHDDGEPHFHEASEEEKNALADFLWRLENVELLTVGIDIGSSTSHLMFAKVHLQRKAQMLSSQFVVVSRKILWKSPILLTPFLPDNTIDAERLRVFIEGAYGEAGLKPTDIDSGAVILTGEAIKRKNAHAIAQLFATDAGKFVCASAGHHLECLLAAHGSGAVGLSKRTHRTILNVDIGGGTTKFALAQNGEIRGTCAVAVGGRLLAHDDQGRWTRIDESAYHAAKALGLAVKPNAPLAPEHLDKLVGALAEVVINVMRGEALTGLGQTLLLTEPITDWTPPHLITFSGGVSEYIFDRESATFQDIAKPLAEKIARAFTDGRIKAKILDPGQGIRATVIGASQFTVQVSGKTIHLSEHAPLPVHNVPVVFPAFPAGEYSPEGVAQAVRTALVRHDQSDPSDQEDPADDRPLALAIRWRGDPHYRRLRDLAEGIVKALGAAVQAKAPLILLVDGDVGKSLGHILEHELHVPRSVISIDSVQLQEFDHVDIGELMEPANVVPVVIKSLLFSAG